MSLPYADLELSDDALTDRVRVLQRRRGHRYSIDDVITARLAIAARPDARSYLDLGCGIGSVLLMVADRLPAVQAAGLEAQIESYALAERNVQRNALAGRVGVQRGDLRDDALLERIRAAVLPAGAAGFDLISGTPPYKPVGTASISPDPQRAHARIELRGGVEAYLRAAARLLASEGRFVMCGEASLEPRVVAGARAVQLRIQRRLDVVARAGKGTLFSVYTFAPAAASGERTLAAHGGASDAVLTFGRGDEQRASTLSGAARAGAAGSALCSAAGPARDTLTLRDARGARTAAANALRAYFGMPASPSEAPSPALRPRHASSRRPA